MQHYQTNVWDSGAVVYVANDQRSKSRGWKQCAGALAEFFAGGFVALTLTHFRISEPGQDEPTYTPDK